MPLYTEPCDSSSGNGLWPRLPLFSLVMADTEVPESLAVALNNSIGTREVSEYFLNLKKHAGSRRLHLIDRQPSSNIFIVPLINSANRESCFDSMTQSRMSRPSCTGAQVPTEARTTELSGLLESEKILGIRELFKPLSPFKPLTALPKAKMEGPPPGH